MSKVHAYQQQLWGGDNSAPSKPSQPICKVISSTAVRIIWSYGENTKLSENVKQDESAQSKIMDEESSLASLSVRSSSKTDNIDPEDEVDEDETDPILISHKLHFEITRQELPPKTIFGDFTDPVIVSGTRRSTIIRGLTPGCQYHFRICGINSMGNGPHSQISDSIEMPSFDSQDSIDDFEVKESKIKMENDVTDASETNSKSGNDKGKKLKAFLSSLSSLNQVSIALKRIFSQFIDPVMFGSLSNEKNDSNSNAKSYPAWPILILRIILSKSDWLLYLMMFYYCYNNGTLLSLFYVFVLFLYLLIDSPRPDPTIFRYCLIYTMGVIALKFLFQLPLFCMRTSDGLSYGYSIQPWCPDRISRSSVDVTQSSRVFGIYKLNFGIELEEGEEETMWSLLKFDLLMLLSILLRQNALQVCAVFFFCCCCLYHYCNDICISFYASFSFCR